MLKKIAKIVILGFIFLFLFISLFLLFLSTHPGEILIKKIAEKQLANNLNQQVQIGELETNLISRIKIRQVRVFNDQDNLLKLGLARINYNLFNFLKRKISPFGN